MPTRRLLFLEFLPGALRRNEKSLFFPFLQGLARRQACATLWLRFGAAVREDRDCARGRSLFAEPSAADLRLLERRLRRWRATHVIASELLSPPVQALLARQRPAPKFLAMPMMMETACAVAPDSEMARHVAALGAAAQDPSLFVRCGWFLAWLDLAEPAWERRYLIGAAKPDYAAVLANPAARAAARGHRFFVSIISGGLCGNLRRVRGNPHFAGVDLSGMDGHRGCSFCRTAGTPSFVAPGADPLALIEQQLRGVLEGSGLSSGPRIFEFLDYRALRRFDEVFAVVLRLKVPPAIFLFNPRIDEVLAAQERIARTLPALARAGHEVRILSMGIENFSPPENARFNKGISPAQVDEFLALARRWEKAYPKLFRPFKGGSEKIELGFILFTPWTTLADLRCNLAGAAQRGFAERGYWLHSTLTIRAGLPIHALARRTGVLTERFPDRGLLYGLVQQEAELKTVVPWRFQDRKVADFYFLMVRLCAAAREGRRCAFFKGEAQYAAISRLGFSARRRGLTPLALALHLLDALEAAQPPYSREELLRQAIARAAPRPRLSPGALAVRRLVRLLRRSRLKAFSDIRFGPVREIVKPGLRCVRLALAVAGKRLVVDLMDASSPEPCFLRTRRFRVVPHRRTLLLAEQRRLGLLARLIDRGLDRVSAPAAAG
jgi:hypothetical protein